MIGKLVIHIGTHKTGTTYIQNNLLMNEEQLTKEGRFIIDRERDANEIKKWLFPKWYNIQNIQEQEEKAFKQLKNIKSKFSGNVIWSEENFSDETSVKEQNIRLNKLKKCIEILSPKEVYIHIFFREKESLLLSLYKQNIRNRNFNYTCFEDFVKQDDDFQNALDWDVYFSRIQKNIPNSFRHSYEMASKKGLVKYFFEQILNIQNYKEHTVDRNESIEDEKVLILEEFGKLVKEKPHLKNCVGWFKAVVIKTKLKN